MANTKKLIAVVGATGLQGGAVMRALQASGQFKVRALTRNPAKHSSSADEVVLADLNRPETLKAAFAGAHGVFVVTDAWEPGTDEGKQASRGKLDVRHFTDKAKIEAIVREAGFARHTFVMAPFYYQNLLGVMAPQKQADGAVGWALPLDPEKRVIHMGDITELGHIVVGAFAQPELAGHGEHLPLVGDFLSFSEVIGTLNQQGHNFSFKQVPQELFAGWFPGAKEIAEMLAYFEAHTYLGADSRDAITLANRVAGREPTKFAAWARANIAIPAAA
jgi:uncharacterized protein YbjT (DUF2867 family)